MKRVILIEDNREARKYVCERAPKDWDIIEAADGLSGLDLVREWLPVLDLVIVDMGLPDVEGEWLCAQIRELRPTLPILPYTATESTKSLLRELACLPPIIKPVGSAQLTTTLAQVFASETPELVESGALAFVRKQSSAVIQERRTQLSGRRIVVIATDEYLRWWLSEMIRPVVTPVHAEHLQALRKTLKMVTVTAVVADAAIYASIAADTRAYGVPVILVATSAMQALALSKASVHRILLSNDSDVGARLRATINGLNGEADEHGWLLDDGVQHSPSSIVPANTLRTLADTPLTVREIEVLWLEHHGLKRAQIAEQMGISPETVSSHWKNAQEKLGMRRGELRSWMQAQLRTRTP